MDVYEIIASYDHGRGNDADSVEPVFALNQSLSDIDPAGTFESAGVTGVQGEESEGLFFEDEPNQSILHESQVHELTKDMSILGDGFKDGGSRPLQGHTQDNRQHVPADPVKSGGRTMLIPTTDSFSYNLHTHPPDAETPSLSESHHRDQPLSSQDIIPVIPERPLGSPCFITQPNRLTTYACTAEFSPAQVPAALRILQYIKSHPTTAKGVNPPVPYELITSELAEIRDGWGWCLIGGCHTTREDKDRASAEKASNRILSSISTDHKHGNVWSRRRADALYDHVRNEHLRYRPYWCEICLKRFSDQTELAQHENAHGYSGGDDTNSREM